MSAKATLDGKLMFPSEYVAAVEFQGKDVPLTIAKVQLDDVPMKDGSKSKKPILYFAETKKKLVLNKTNASTIAELHGTEARQWIGKRIVLYPTTCTSFGEIVACIRVRPAAPPARRSAAEEPPAEMDAPPIGPEEAAAIADEEARQAKEGR